MPGASKDSQRVKILNANWTPDPAGSDGTFEFLIITQDDQRHTFTASPQAAIALVALARAETILVWDPADQILIVANIIGTMPWTKHLDDPRA